MLVPPFTTEDVISMLPYFLTKRTPILFRVTAEPSLFLPEESLIICVDALCRRRWSLTPPSSVR